MIYDEENDSCIVYEKDGGTQNLVSFYNEYPICDGEILIKEEIYEVNNPCWLSDTFVFCKKHYNDVDLVCYIKVNNHNQIEEIGSDFEARFNCDFTTILKRKDVIQATNLHKIIFTLIDEEYWFTKKQLNIT